MQALVSVYDKTGIAEFGKLLSRAGYDVISTGTTAGVLSKAGVKVRQVADVTGSPEILDGRVKTLHPKIHGGILARRDLAPHMDELRAQGISTVDVVVCNLYPFVDTISKQGVTLADALENIDIGGPAMTRAAAKNYPSVVIVVDPADYERVGDMLLHGDVPMEERRRLAAKAFQHVALYDTAISNYLRSLEESPDQVDSQFPHEYTAGWNRVVIPRYGENPHQAAAVYANQGEKGGIVNARVIRGIGMSYLNYFDADAAWESANAFGQHAVSIVKHANPCGLAVHEDQAEAYRRALEGDPVSAYGGIVGFNSIVTEETAVAMKGVLFDVIAAPGYEEGALKVFEGRKRTRVLEVGPRTTRPLAIRTVTGGALIQQPDDIIEDSRLWKVVTRRQPTKQEMDDLAFAWQACRFIHSNAIVFAKDQYLVGMGAGQPNRVTSVFLAGRAAGDKARGASLASDAFFPFPDGIEKAAEAGITAVAQPGGSIRDDEVIETADKLDLAMVFTGTRHFLH